MEIRVLEMEGWAAGSGFRWGPSVVSRLVGQGLIELDLRDGLRLGGIDDWGLIERELALGWWSGWR